MAVTQRKSPGNKAARDRAPATPKPRAKSAVGAGAARATTPASAKDAAKSVKRKARAADPARLMKDTFRMPAAEFDRLRALKRRARALGRPAKKSELLRAGLRLLAEGDDAALLDALGVARR